MAEKKLTFEQAMARLEEIAMLDKAEQKVMKLRLDETGELKEVPFVPEES